MRDRTADAVALIHRLLAYTFAVVGALFLLAPNGTVRVINAAAAVLRVFPPAPQSDLRFWLSLGFAYMTLVTALAWRISADPRRYGELMPILALGKFASSTTCLVFFVSYQPTFLYLLNFLVDGSIVLLVMGCYAAIAVTAPGITEPSPRVQHVLRAVTETMATPELVHLAGDDVPMIVWRYFRDLLPTGTVLLTAMLYAIEFAPLVFGPRRMRFSRLSSAEREAALAGWETSRIPARRQMLNGLKLAVTLHVYDAPPVCRDLGYDGAYLRDKLLAGPNAAAHRARLAS